jgi:hypothetical protein
MTDDLLADLLRLQSYAAGFQRLLREAQASSPPRAQGSDRSGSVTMIVGQDGLPVSIWVSPDWGRRIQPGAFGDAVVEASQSAQGERLAAWVDALERDGWPAKVNRLQAELDAPGATAGADPVPGEIPPAYRRAPDAPRPRPLDVVIEDALRTFDAAEEYRPPPPASVQAAGSAAESRFTITLSEEGLVACVADPRWVAGQTQTALANAFSQAITEARDALARASASAAEAAPPNPADRLKDLFGETMALLGDPRRLAES